MELSAYLIPLVAVIVVWPRMSPQWTLERILEIPPSRMAVPG